MTTLCGMIKVWPDMDGMGQESPCQNAATHSVYGDAQPICAECLQGLKDEGVLSERELQTIQARTS
jgi:hypothetical protein